ncbi:MAG: MBL fold metallo-hydrolase [Sphingomonadales bacterium]|nr:MBL fold metallo-hydrolase [Sphingomonadales bacterium]
MTKRVNWVIAALLLLIGAPYYWFLIDNRPGDVAAKPVTIAQLHQLADAMPGPHPTSVEVELIGGRKVPSTVLVAGTGLIEQPIAIMAFRLPVAGGKPIVIDSGITQSEGEEMGLQSWQPQRQAAVERAMDEAGLILFTHEHPDHIGGMTAWIGKTGGFTGEAAAKIRLNRPQAEESARRLRIRHIDAGLNTTDAPFAVAPGVVAIPAPSHTPGSQMFFVRLANGREYLFAGDIATMAASWEQLRARSRLAGTILAPEDRRAVYAWLKTIRALKAADPSLIVVPGHDAGPVLDRASGIRDGFDLSQIKA